MAISAIDYHLGNPSPNSTHEKLQVPQEFQISEFFMFDDSTFEENSSLQSMITTEKVNDDQSVGFVADANSRNINIRRNDGIRKKSKTMDMGSKVAFKTKSELEVMDDGFKWRKYGKKSVKNSPYPRNYYKCSCQGCHVKKRVERDRDDSSYVITTYDGVHNHESPSVVYYNQIPDCMVPNGWTRQPPFLS